MGLLDETPERVLAIYAHPDDPEISCAGTLARWASAGAEVHLVICNCGEKGAGDTGATGDEIAATRAGEADEAASAMGLTTHENLGYPDGEIDNTPALREQLVARIRAHRPDVVICPDPTAVFFGASYLNHRDHREVGWAVLDACAPAAANARYFPDAGPAHQVAEVLMSGTFEPDAWVDIEPVLDVKIAALRCHRSQLGGSDEFVADLVRARAEEAGEAAGARYAEGYRRLVLGPHPELA